MSRTREQLEVAATDAETWLDSLDPATTAVEETADLRAIVGALNEVAAAEGALSAAVADARGHGRSWGRIAMALGVSKQAACQRYGAPSQVGRHPVGG